MSEYSVLQSEPRYRVDAFVAEMVERARTVIDDMRSTWERLLREMAAQFDAFQQRHYLISLKDVRFDKVHWARDGHLVITFAPIKERMPEDLPRHVVIDTFVDDVVGRTVIPELRDEFAGFLRGMIVQFAMLKKHNVIADLRAITFDSIEWLDAHHLSIQMKRNGKPFCPRDARWD